MRNFLNRFNTSNDPIESENAGNISTLARIIIICCHNVVKSCFQCNVSILKHTERDNNLTPKDFFLFKKNGFHHFDEKAEPSFPPKINSDLICSKVLQTSHAIYSRSHYLMPSSLLKVAVSRCVDLLDYLF